MLACSRYQTLRKQPMKSRPDTPEIIRRRPIGRVRLSDVAELAGVSLGSASRALSVPDLVKPVTLKRVREAAERLGYVPDGAARALVMGRSETIGVVLPTINNPIYSDFVHALQKRLSDDGYQLLISAHEYDRVAEKRQIERLLLRGVDGLVLVGSEHDAETLARLQRAAVPVLFAWSIDDTQRRTGVGFSNRLAIQPIVRHLLDLGHRRFAVLSGDPADNERARSRLEGIREALAAAEVELPEAAIVIGPFTIEAGRAGLRRVRQSHPAATALICTTDLIAAGALAEARAMGIAVPDQLSITGFDDIELAALLTPALTPVHVPTDALGDLAADRMLAALKSGEALRSAEVATQLVIRASSGPAPATLKSRRKR